MKSTVMALAAGLFFLLWQALAAGDEGLREAIRAEVELLRESGQISVGAFEIAAPELVAEVYERRGFAAAWDQPEDADSLIGVIQATADDGLTPTDYHLDTINEVDAILRGGRKLTTRGRAAYDLMLTDSLIRIVYHQRFGKVDPETLEATWEFDRLLDGDDPVFVIDSIIEADSIPAAIESSHPHGAHYDRLAAALDHYRALADAGGWPLIPDGPTIRPGEDDSRLPALAHRLEITGDLVTKDEPLVDAVRRFQARHGLETDGLVGSATLAALNVLVEDRIDQIRLNLERARWVFDGTGDDFVLVNIAGFRAYVVQDGRVVWTTRVVVGETQDKTPVFRSAMKYVVFNPTWTVPRRIATEEMLPRIKTNPEYLERNNYDLVDRDGNVVDAASVDWDAMSESNFPFTMVQRAGPANELGQVKFMFPNEYAVCMHDTPGKYLFEKNERAFSHGCIRVDKPFDLAEVLLVNEGWTREMIDTQVASAETKAVFLSTPLPMLLLYWTAEVDDGSVIHFYNDIYGRDAAVLAALDEKLGGQLP